MKSVKSIKSNAFLLLIIAIFFTSISVNIFIENQNQDLKTKYSILDPNNPYQGKNLENRKKISDVIDQQSVYDPGASVHVKGQVDYANYLGVSNQYWFIPFQSVEVYIKENPCASDPCDTSSLNSYKLQVSAGNPATGGTTDQEPFGLDDTYGILDNPNSTYLNEAKGALSYDFYVSIPTESQLQALGINGPVQLYEYYPGNTSFSLNFPAWNIANTTINVNAFPQTTVFSLTNTPNNISANLNSTTFSFNAHVKTTSSSTNVDNAQIDFKIEYLGDNTVCSTNSGNCNNLGLDVQISNNNFTDSFGNIDFTVGFQSLGSAPEGDYNFTAIARFVDPDNPANNKTGSPFKIQQNEFNFTIFSINYQLKQGQVAKSTYTGYGTDIFPLDQANPRIRPGDYFLGTVKNTIVGESTSISGVNLTYQLFDSTLTTNYTAMLLAGSGWAKLSLNNQILTNSSGELEFNLSLGLDVPTGSYSLIVKGDYSSVYNTSPYWLKDQASFNSVTYTFSVSNLFDSGSLTLVRVIPGNSVRPTTSGNSMILEFQANASTNTVYKSYADKYGVPIASSYNLVNLPVNASMVGGSISGITVSIGGSFGVYNASYYYTDANGKINVTITGTYPQVFLKKTFQLKLTADYSPMITTSPTSYRFTRDTGLTNISTITTPVLSIDPNYTVIDIRYVLNNKTGSNVNDFQIRPGENILFIFESYDTKSTLVKGNVPFNLSVVAGMFTAGLMVTTNNTFSDANGRIFIFVSTIYGVTNETVSSIQVKFNVNLNITLYNQTAVDNQFYVGVNHLGSTNYNDYQITWSDVNSSLLINASYLYANLVWDYTIDDSQILNPSLNLVRPNNQTIKVTLYIKFDNGTTITGYTIPVNVTFITAYQGVNLTIADTTKFPLSKTGWYLTNTSGIIEFNITLNYDSTIPKYDLIKLNATADFNNDTCITCTTDFSNWIVGRSAVTGKNQSQASFATITNTGKLLKLTKQPVYVTGALTIVSVAPSNLVPNTIISITYKVYIPKTSTNASYDSLTSGGTVDRVITGINVYLNETQLSNYNMTLAQNGLVSDVNGLVTFSVNVTNNTVDGTYQLTAYADFENDLSMTIPVANSTGTFNYFWLNGTTSTLDPINGSFSIKNYSKINSSDITVKRARSTTIVITRVFDQNDNLVPSTPAPVEALRNYTLELQVLYKDQDNNRFAASIRLIVQMLSNSGQIQNFTVANFATTNVTGFATANLTLSSTYFAGEAGIIAEDQNLPAATPFIPSPANFTLLSRLELIITNFNTVNSSDQAFVGENIAVSGYIQDEFGQMGSNLYSPTVLNELSNSLVLTGLDPSNNTVAGTQVTSNLTIGTTTATFSLNLIIPFSYNLASIRIRLEIVQTGSIAHFVDGTGKINGSLPTNYTSLIAVYQNTSYFFSVSNSDATGGIYSNTIINVTDNTAALTISGQLRDNYNNPIKNRYIRLSWNSSSVSGLSIINLQTDSAGNFATSLIPLSLVNETYMLFISHILANGTVFNEWSNIIIRTVFDHDIPIITPISSFSTYIIQNTSFSFVVADNTTGVTSSGLLVTSVSLYRNGTLVWQNTGGNQIWSGTGNLVLIYNMSDINQNSFDSVNFTLIALDNSNNLASYQTIFLFDKVSPTINYLTPNSTKLYIFENNREFLLNATDFESQIDPTTAIVNINGVDYSMKYDSSRKLFFNDTQSFKGITANVSVYYSIADIAGNRANTSTIVFMADTIVPVISYDSSTSGFVNNTYATLRAYSLIFNIEDTQSGLDLSQADIIKDGVSLGTFPTFINSNSQARVNITLPPRMTQNTFYQIVIYDNNGNQVTSSKVILVADLTAPSLSIINPTKTSTDEYEAINDLMVFEFQFSDAQTSVSLNSLKLDQTKTGSNVSLLNSTDFVFTQAGQGYNVKFNFSRDNFEPDKDTQLFYLSGEDGNGNKVTYKFTVLVDVLGPRISSIQVSQPNITNILEPGENASASVQYITFEYQDLGTPTTGVDNSAMTVSLTVNGSFSVSLDINGNQISVSNSSVRNDFSVVSNDNSKLILAWNVSDTSLYNIEQNFDNQTVPITWELTNLKDNYGNSLQSPGRISYTLSIEALPPPPDVVGAIITAATSFSIFLVVGIGAAFIFEKIRYIG